jgi:hypothetical protein
MPEALSLGGEPHLGTGRSCSTGQTCCSTLESIDEPTWRVLLVFAAWDQLGLALIAGLVTAFSSWWRGRAPKGTRRDPTAIAQPRSGPVPWWAPPAAGLFNAAFLLLLLSPDLEPAAVGFILLLLWSPPLSYEAATWLFRILGFRRPGASLLGGKAPLRRG